MGLVYTANKGLIKSYVEETVKYKNALIEPGKTEAEIKLAALSSAEVERILLKLDMLAMEKMYSPVAIMVAEEADSILALIRMVKVEAKAEFAGMLGAGSNLDIAWLRPKDIGGVLLNPAATASKGLYGGASGGVYTWLNTFVANTSDDLIPEQTMAEEAGVIHLGAIDPIEVPKLNGIRFTLAGIPTPYQSLPFNLRQSLGPESLPCVRYEKPIIVGPQKKQAIDVMPNISGDSKYQLMTLLVAKAENLTL